MRYPDQDKAENECVEQNIGIEMAEQVFSRRRGMQDIWDAAERDIALQSRGGSPPLLIFAEIGEGVTGISSEREEEGKSLSVSIVI
jgi:hypothetical protein